MKLKFFLKTLPVLMGYIPLGMAYGILFVTELPFLPWYYGALISVVVYAGSGQFLLVSLLSAYSGYLEIAVASFLLNSRHIFYGISMVQDMQNFPFFKKYFIIFCLTDESYALLKDSDFSEEEKQQAYLWIAGLDYLYWVSGSFLGVLLGSQVEFSWQGISFALTALFAVLTLSLLLKSSNKIPFYVSLVVSFAGIFIFPGDKMLILSIICILFVLLFLEWRKHG